MGVVLSIAIHDCPWRETAKREKETVLMAFVNSWIQLYPKTYLPIRVPGTPIDTFLGLFQQV